jgi:hypothetical protein
MINYYDILEEIKVSYKFLKSIVKGDILLKKDGVEFYYVGTDYVTFWIEPCISERKTKYVDENYIYLNVDFICLFRLKSIDIIREHKLTQLGI